MDKKQIIKFETENLLKKLINNFKVEIQQDDAIFHIIIKVEEEAPTLIGRHGETIRAIQRILEVIFYKIFKEPIEILLNINDFREKQKERLENLAKEFAEKAKMNKESVFIKNLSAYERKIIHEYINKKYPKLTSYSQGEGRERKLVIDFKEKLKE